MLNLNDITLNKQLDNLKGKSFEMPYVSYCQPLATRRRKNRHRDNDNRKEWFENENKGKKIQFFADPHKRKAESRHTFGTTCPDLLGLPFVRHTSQRFAKVKEPNLPTHELE